jgi:microsomal dipeptidase-like Zn-dependent dipeptidase
VGIQSWGRGIVNILLSRQLGGSAVRRILVDVKHMSPQARLDYYAMLDVMHANPNERIPIIKSHTAVSGRRNIKRSIDHDYAVLNDEKETTKYFYDGIINLFDDEIVRIVHSDGLIGLMIDERRIMGRALPPESGFKKKSDFNKMAKQSGKALNSIIRCKHKITRLLRDLAADPGNVNIQKDIQNQQATLKAAEKTKNAAIPKLRPAYFSVILRQIFHILDLTGEKGWDHLSLGTDYDGVINPIDIYAQSSDMASIYTDLVAFWNSALQHPDQDIRNLYQRNLFGKSPEWWIKKLLLTTISAMVSYHRLVGH